MIGYCPRNLFIFSTPTFLDCERTGHPCECTWALSASLLVLLLLKAFSFGNEFKDLGNPPSSVSQRLCHLALIKISVEIILMRFQAITVNQKYSVSDIFSYQSNFKIKKHKFIFPSPPVVVIMPMFQQCTQPCLFLTLNINSGVIRAENEGRNQFLNVFLFHLCLQKLTCIYGSYNHAGGSWLPSGPHKCRL